MNLSLLQTLTWSTVAGAVISALALAATEAGAPAFDESAGALPPGPPALPVEPTAAGRPTPAASAAAPVVARSGRP